MRGSMDQEPLLIFHLASGTAVYGVEDRSYGNFGKADGYLATNPGYAALDTSTNGSDTENGPEERANILVTWKIRNDVTKFRAHRLWERILRKDII